MPTYRLKYFKGRGRGEVIRMLFAMAEQPFEDIRYTQEEFKATEKANTPFGQVPVLEIDGKSYTQSEGIARFLAKRFGFYGKNDIEMLEIEQVLGIYQDVAQRLMAFGHEKDEARKAEIEKESKEVKLPFLLGCLEKLLKQNKTGYFVGDSITLADIATFILSDHLSQVLNADDFPLLTKVRELVGADLRMKAWLDKREALEKN